MRRVGIVFLAASWFCALSTGSSAAELTPGEIHSVGPLTIDLAEAESSTPSCPPPGEHAVLAEPLGHVRQALQPGDRLDVLAVGSATVLGPDGLHPELGFSYRMAQALKTAAPQTEVTLTLRGGKGITAEQSRAAMAEAVAAHTYQLVLWQAGTVEAMRGMPAQDLYDTLAAGASSLREGSDLVLVDPQYSRLMTANMNIEPYETAIVRAAALPGVVLFPRFDLMRRWADHGMIDLERAPPAERASTADRLHSCLGRFLARMVLAGAGLQAAK